jgi:hypothetical protein
MEHPEQGQHNGTANTAFLRSTMEHSFKGGENIWRIQTQWDQTQPRGKHTTRNL